jgi:uncharacterized protein (TIGR02145 family)
MINFAAEHYRKIVGAILWIILFSCVIFGGILGDKIGHNEGAVAGIILGFVVGLFTSVFFGGLVAVFLNIAEDVKNMNKLLSSQHNETRRKNKAITEKGSFTDTRDGKVYKTVKIGTQIWMAENLNYEAEGSKCYDNNPANGQKYGRLYNWETAKKACPPGWHLPSDAEWQELVNSAGGDKIAGEELKAKSGWNSNGNGTDEYGFSALPGGRGYSDGVFDFAGSNGYWWSATEYSASSAWYRYMLYGRADVLRDSNDKTYLRSVRCVQD